MQTYYHQYLTIATPMLLLLATTIATTATTYLHFDPQYALEWTAGLQTTDPVVVPAARICAPHRRWPTSALVSSSLYPHEKLGGHGLEGSHHL